MQWLNAITIYNYEIIQIQIIRFWVIFFSLLFTDNSAIDEQSYKLEEIMKTLILIVNIVTIYVSQCSTVSISFYLCTYQQVISSAYMKIIIQ